MSDLYSRLISTVFFAEWRPGATEVAFNRTDIEEAARKLKIAVPKNIGDAIYSFRYRRELPSRIRTTAPEGADWIIEGAGRSKYRFRLSQAGRIVPRADFVAIKIPDATPEIISSYAFTDEQALLAKLRYNRLVDLFLGLTAYSLQSHMRTSVKDLGQIEIDEVYVGVSRSGAQYIIPVQAKGGSDKLSSVQTDQDMRLCAERFPKLVCRPISAQFMTNDVIAMFELAKEDGEIRVADERHYRLVHRDEIDPADLAAYLERQR